MCVKRRTAAYKDTHQKNTSVLKKHIKHNLTQTKAVITTLKTNTDNILSSAKKTIRTSIIKPLKLLS
jgi:hypothetical protein